MANCHNNDDGEIIKIVIAGIECLAVESYQTRFTHATLVNKANHDKAHGKIVQDVKLYQQYIG